MKPSDDNAANDLPPGAPGEGTRTIISLLIFIHFFAVGLAIMCNSESGPSTLLTDVKVRPRFVQFYLTQFWLDHGYDYYLMNGANWDFFLKANINYADGHKAEEITLPDSGIWSGDRRQRYQQLAASVAANITRGNDENVTEDEAADNAFRKPLLPKSIGASLIRRHPGAQSVSLKCIYHEGISIPGLLSPDSKENDPNGAALFTTVGDMAIVLDRDEPKVFENVPAAESSPVRTTAESKPKPATATKRGPAPAAKGDR